MIDYTPRLKSMRMKKIKNLHKVPRYSRDLRVSQEGIVSICFTMTPSKENFRRIQLIRDTYRRFKKTVTRNLQTKEAIRY